MSNEKGCIYVVPFLCSWGKLDAATILSTETVIAKLSKYPRIAR